MKKVMMLFVATAIGLFSSTSYALTAADGATLYGTYCSSCHKALASSAKKGRTGTQISTAIATVSKMKSLSVLTTTQISAIALALAPTTPTPTPTACTYTYSAWSACTSNNTQTRTVTASTPAGCTGTPLTTQFCNYVPPVAPTGKITVIGWNDLGMHCMNSEFKEMAILPPYNNLKVQVIQQGNTPKVITSGITVEYSIINNTTSDTKTDF